MINLLKFMAEWGIWDIAGLVITIFPVMFLIIYLFPRRKIKNLYIDTRIGAANTPYDKVILIELRNHTNTPIYVLSEGFKFDHKINPSPFGSKNANTNTYEWIFDGCQIMSSLLPSSISQHPLPLLGTVPVARCKSHA